MGGILFSVTVSVSLMAAMLLLLKGRIAKRYGFRTIYILSLILAVRLVIPYSIQLPDVPKWSITIPSFVPAIWIVGSILCLMWQVGKYFYLKKLILEKGEYVREKRILDIIGNVKSRMFIDKDISVLISENIGSPMLLGFIRPYIIIPLHRYSEEELEMIFCHELMHYKHKDAYKKLFFSVVAAVQWFNPFVWLLVRECIGSLEVMCDEAVTKNSDKQYKRDYCYMLLKMGEQSGSLTTAASYFSTKEMLKMRIDNVFNRKKKRSGGKLIVSSVLCLSFISSLLCSCTVETPQDVIEDMERIESGIENEQQNGVIDGENSEITLKPVSEVTVSATNELSAIAATDGIFKLDNCDIVIPQTDSLSIYSQNFIYGIETPQKIYDQLRWLEKEWLGGNYYPDEAFIAVPCGYVGAEREELTIEQYLNDNRIAAIYNSSQNYDGENYGNIECMVYSLRLWETPLLESKFALIAEEDGYLDRDLADRVISCLNADEDTLSQTLKLIDGEITVGEVVEKAESYMRDFPYVVDDRITYKVQTLYIHKLTDGTEIVDIKLRIYYDGVPLQYISVPKDEAPFSMADTFGTDCMEMKMIRSDGFDCIITFKTNTKLTLTDEKVTEIVPVSEVFEMIKGNLSNSIVYDVQEVSLGYLDTYRDMPDCMENAVAYTMPVWSVYLSISGIDKDIVATVNAVTGELYLWDSYR